MILYRRIREYVEIWYINVKYVVYILEFVNYFISY